MSHAAANQPPRRYKQFIQRFPKLGAAHDLCDEAGAEGPLDPKTCSLIKIGLAIGAGLESAVKAHVRKARRHGATVAEIEQTIAQAMTTVGFPRTVAAWSWMFEQLDREQADEAQPRDVDPTSTP